jgi:hypothetical protein
MNQWVGKGVCGKHYLQKLKDDIQKQPAHISRSDLCPSYTEKYFHNVQGHSAAGVQQSLL